LYFSCKNYQELAQTRITKIVRYFTNNPTKFVLKYSDFSSIFYAIYNNQQEALYYLSYHLQEGPRKELLFCNVVPGAADRRGWSNSRRARRRLGQGRAGEGS
jgi:hypothetical protein